MNVSRPGVFLLLAVLCAAASGHAEIYRWRDASGREHFTTELHEVPADQRPAARERAEEGGAAVNFHSGPDRAPATRHGPARSKAAPAKAAESPAFDCAAIQKEAKRQRNLISRQEKRVAARRKQAEDFDASDTWRRKNEIRMEKEAQGLSRLEAAFDRFATDQRHAGVPPGCLR